MNAWLDAARAALLEELYRGRTLLLVGVGEGDGEVVRRLLSRGVGQVVVVESDPQRLEAVRRGLAGVTGSERCELRGGPSQRRFDVVMARLDPTRAEVASDVARLHERVAAGGWLVVTATSRERDAERGVDYYVLDDAMAAHFPAVTMLGQTRLTATALAPFGEEEAEPILDSLVDAPAEPELYVAVGGPRRLAAGYSLALLPSTATAAAATIPTATARPAVDQRRQVELERAAGEAEARAKAEEKAARAELTEQLAARERGMEELRLSTRHHVQEMRVIRGALEERDAYIAELEQTTREVEPLRAKVATAETRADEAEKRERSARKQVAELDGKLLRATEEKAAVPAVTVDVSSLEKKIVELTAAFEKQKTRSDDLQREAWGHLRARSEAEAGAAEVREDTVRKLKDARKVANIELMRAMEEATKKAVSLKEELTRTERERKEGVMVIKASREEIAGLQAQIEAARAETAGLQPQLEAARAEIAAQQPQLEAARAETAALQAELDGARAEIAGLRTELEAARHTPPQAAPQPGPSDGELAELSSLRQRAGELEAELGRRVGELRAVEAERAELLERLGGAEARAAEAGELGGRVAMMVAREAELGEAERRAWRERDEVVERATALEARATQAVEEERRATVERDEALAALARLGAPRLRTEVERMESLVAGEVERLGRLEEDLGRLVAQVAATAAESPPAASSSGPNGESEG